MVSTRPHVSGRNTARPKGQTPKPRKRPKNGRPGDFGRDPISGKVIRSKHR